MDEKTQLLLSVGHHLRQLLLKRAHSSATIDKACSEYYEFLYNMRNTSASVIHLVLHFTTFNIKGRNKLGEIVQSNAVAANVGCELIDFVERRCKTGPKLENHGITSASSGSANVISRDSGLKSDLSETGVKMELGEKPPKKSRWKRFKEKMASKKSTCNDQTKLAVPPAPVSNWIRGNGASVAVSSAPAAVSTHHFVAAAPKKIVASPASIEEKQVEERTKLAGYDAYRRISEGTSNDLAADMELVARARVLPLRIPLSREMEPSIVRPSHKPLKQQRWKKKQKAKQKSAPHTPGPSTSQRGVVQLRDPSPVRQKGCSVKRLRAIIAQSKKRRKPDAS